MLRVHACAVVVVLAAAACSGGDDSSSTRPTTQGPTGTSASQNDDTTPTTQPTATAARERSAAVSASGLAGAETAWVAMWDGVELVVTDPSEAEARITDVATVEVFGLLERLYNPSVEVGDAGVAMSARTFDNYPVVADGDGVAVIDDCVKVTPLETAPFVWYSGTARVENDGLWRIESVTPEALSGCVPAEIANAAIAGYEAYWDARVEFWDPADPDHPLIDQTLTGVQLEVVRGLLVDHRARGLVLRGRPETHPEVVQIASATELTLLDCQIQDPGRGVFNTATGERTDDIAPVVEGQRDLRSAVMVLEDGVWKVSDVQGQANVRCELAPTVQGLPAV